MIQLYIYTLFFLSFFIMVYYKMLNVVPLLYSRTLLSVLYVIVCITNYSNSNSNPKLPVLPYPCKAVLNHMKCGVVYCKVSEITGGNRTELQGFLGSLWWFPVSLGPGCSSISCHLRSPPGSVWVECFGVL